MSWLSQLLGGPSPTTTQTTTSVPSKDQQSLISAGQPFAQKFAQQGGVTLPEKAPIAPFDPNQLLGQMMALNAAQPQGGIVGAAGKGNQFLSSGAALDPSTNPGLAAAIKYATMPIQQNFEESVLPGIRQSAVGAGGYGGSREGIAEGIAARGEEQAVGSTTANLVNANYMNALDQMAKGQAVAPSVAASQTMPATTTSGVGDVNQAMQQAMQSYGFNRDIYGQENPLATAQALMGLSAGIPGGSTTTSGSYQANMNPLQGALGLMGIGLPMLGLGGGGGTGGSGGGGARGGSMGGGGGGFGSSLLPSASTMSSGMSSLGEVLNGLNLGSLFGVPAATAFLG